MDYQMNKYEDKIYEIIIEINTIPIDIRIHIIIKIIM